MRHVHHCVSGFSTVTYGTVIQACHPGVSSLQNFTELDTYLCTLYIIVQSLKKKSIIQALASPCLISHQSLVLCFPTPLTSFRFPTH